MPESWTVQARWLFPVDQPSIEGGTLTMHGDRIIAVEPRRATRPDVDLGDVALLPGLVNTHTHLDLGGLRGKRSPPNDFTQWLRAVVAYRRSSSPAVWEQASQAGIAECLSSGTTLLGDIAAGGLSAPILAEAPLRAVVFYELIGLTRARARQTWHEAADWLRQQRPTVKYRPGLSPHAPYSVRESLFRAAARQPVPLAIHLAETPHEEQLLAAHHGPLRGFLEEIGAWEEEGLTASLSRLVQLNQNAPRVLFVHGNYLNQSWWNHLGRSHSVIYCPRTHAYFGHPPHPFREMLQAGINVALGTDSLASNPDLSILEEMRFLRKHYPDLPGEVILRLGTLAGARALGWDRETGSLTSGKFADWITVPLDSSCGPDPHEQVLQSSCTVRDVCIGGQWLVRDLNKPTSQSPPA